MNLRPLPCEGKKWLCRRASIEGARVSWQAQMSRNCLEIAPALHTVQPSHKAIELSDVDLWLAGTQADVKHLLKPPAVEEIVAASL